MSRPGSKWRTLAHVQATGMPIEDKSTEHQPSVFDEVVVDDWLHLEQLSARVWWMRLGDAYIIVRVGKDGKAEVNIRRGEYGEARGWTEI